MSLAHQLPIARSNETCRFFIQGTCRYGFNCRFSHSTPSTAVKIVEPEAPVLRSDTRSQKPCLFYLRGHCKNADNCPYAHDLSSLSDELSAATLQDDPEADSWARDIYGTLTQFGDGAKVLKISLASDFSAIHISKLDPGSSAASVVDLLARVGFAVPIDCVRLQPQGSIEHCSASVRVPDLSFAKRSCMKLASRKAKGDKSFQVDVTPINCPIPQGSSHRRVDCKKVHCSWHRPFRLVWLNFGSSGIAQTVCDRFNAGRYLVLGQQVTSTGPKKSGGFHNPLAWTIVLSNVPAAANKTDITCNIPPTIQPRHVELGKPGYGASLDTANAIVKSQLMQIGSLEWWEDANNTGGKRAKAKARFLSEEDARKAVLVLNGTTLSFSKSAKLSAQLVHSTKIKVSERIFSFVKAKIDVEKAAWKSQYLLFMSYEPIRGYRSLKIEGEDSKHVANAKKTLEKILEGEVAMSEGKVLWMPAFGINGEAYRKLKEMERTVGVLVVRNLRRSRLHLYGQTESCKEAQRLITELAKDDVSARHVINLDPDQFVWACHGGFKVISSALGEGTVAFDIISNPKRILINGSEEDFETVMRLITSQSGAELEKETSEEKECSICWVEAENPVLTRCKHTYCANCLEMLCFSRTKGDEEVLIQCEGNSSRCKAIIPIDELKEHLSSNAFEDLLEASFTSHVRQHPQSFRYCPTPDCSQVYRVTSAASTITCPACLVSLCAACHTLHPGITCTEHKDIASGGYEALEKTKAKLGIKDCPKCKTPIEKIDGCDHMTCLGCKAHICWVCLQTFTNGPLCYNHMQEKHGSIGLDHLNNI